jgi:hypothetical protein
MDGDTDDTWPDAEFDEWHVYAVGSPIRSLRIRYRDAGEVPGWQDGPNVRTALRDAESQGWRVYDREPGAAPGEVTILHLIREACPAVG